MRLSTMRAIDRWLGLPLCWLLTGARRVGDLAGRGPAQGARSIVFVKLAEQGSTVLAADALERAVELVGRDNVHFVAFEENRFILDVLGVIPEENVVAIRTGGVVATLVRTLGAVRRLRRLRPDAAIDLEFFARSSAALTYLSGARTRVGFHAGPAEGPGRGDLMTHRLRFNPHMHASQIFRFMVDALEADPGALPTTRVPVRPGVPPEPTFEPRPDEAERVGALLDDTLGRERGPLVLLNANCSDLIPLRAWPRDRYVELARRLLEWRDDVRIALTGAPAEAEPAARLAEEVGSARCVSLAGRTSLRELLVLFSLADALVTNDSGPAHFATLTPIRVVTLFGPEHPDLFASLSPRNHVLWAGGRVQPVRQRVQQPRVPLPRQRLHAGDRRRRGLRRRPVRPRGRRRRRRQPAAGRDATRRRRGARAGGDGVTRPVRTDPATRARPIGALLVALVVLVGYAVAPDRLPLVGEETCRAQHGIEMVENDEWIIATNQGVPILDRPPGQYWALAVVHAWVHPLDPTTLRLFMAAVTLAIALVTWWYASAFLAPAAAVLAGVAYPTMGHIFDLGRRVETDGLFAALLAASLLVWHRGYLRAGPASTWVLACLIAAGATLTKGLQGPVAFFGAIYLFLLLRRDWRWLFHWGHLVGLALFAGAVAAFQVPLWLAEGWEGTRATWLDPGGSRVSASLADLGAHMATFPLAIFVATLPWSPLLIGLLDPKAWRLGAERRSAMLFLVLGAAAIFGPVWITAGGHHRYAIPMYPLLGVMAAIVADRALALDLSYSLRRFYRDFLRILACVFVGVALFFVGVTVAAPTVGSRWAETLAQPWPLLAGLAPALVVVAVWLYRRAPRDTPAHGGLSPFLVGLAMAMVFNSAVINALRARATDPGPEVARLRAETLPEGVRLVSFRPVHHKFVYWYADPIPHLPWPESIEDVPPDVEYFAFTQRRGRDRVLPFAWETLAVLNMDRTVSDDPENAVVVGRRLPGPAGGE